MAGTSKDANNIGTLWEKITSQATTCVDSGGIQGKIRTVMTLRYSKDEKIRDDPPEV